MGETLLPKRLALPDFCSDPLPPNAHATEEIVLFLSLRGRILPHLAPRWGSGFTDAATSPRASDSPRTVARRMDSVGAEFCGEEVESLPRSVDVRDAVGVRVGGLHHADAAVDPVARSKHCPGQEGGDE